MGDGLLMGTMSKGGGDGVMLKKDYEEMTKALVEAMNKLDPKGHFSNCTGHTEYNRHRQVVVDSVRSIMKSYGVEVTA